MRIIAGRARGALLRGPKGSHLRPTLGRAREALFSILTTQLGGFHELKVLDLFAGSGALGLEAWSRGAKQITFVDYHRESLKLIRHNAAAIGALDATTIIAGRLPGVLEQVSQKPQLVFIDPPYSKGLVLPCLQGLLEAELLNPDCCIVVEHEAEFEWSTQVIDSVQLDLERTRKHGAGALSILWT